MDVSRVSGRIRKKSSKLADSFTGDGDEAADEQHQQQLTAGEESPIEDLDDLQEADYDIREEDFDQIPDVVHSELENDEDIDVGGGGAAATADPDDDNLVIDTDSKASKHQRPSSSIYLAEKRPKAGGGSGKASVTAAPSSSEKSTRKDKGKPRFTAYMLWAKANRDKVTKEINAAQGHQQTIDFNAVTKRLSEIWSSVPMSERYLWKKKASELSRRMANRQQVLLSLQQKASRKPESAAAAAAAAGAAAIKPAQTSRLKAPPSTAPIPNPVFKVTGSEPLDCAAHLKLLGESLSVIGQRLRERDGQIAVSGSLSVLLDSMLCAMAPLLCVTQQVPEMRDAVPQETLNKMLDNIAYIIPGL